MRSAKISDFSTPLSHTCMITQLISTVGHFSTTPLARTSLMEAPLGQRKRAYHKVALHYVMKLPENGPTSMRFALKPRPTDWLTYRGGRASWGGSPRGCPTTAWKPSRPWSGPESALSTSPGRRNRIMMDQQKKFQFLSGEAIERKASISGGLL